MDEQTEEVGKSTYTKLGKKNNSFCRFKKIRVTGKETENQTENTIILCYIPVTFLHFEYCTALFSLEKDALHCKRNDWDIHSQNHK